MAESFIPRIAFENEDDQSTVYLALVHYARHQTGNILMGRMGAVSELANAASLIQEIQEAAHTRETFGPIPSDDEIADALAQMESGDDSE